MNIGNITSDNFNLDGNGKDIQIEVYEQLIEQLKKENQKYKEVIDKAIKYKETKQKEFIDYLTSYIELLNNKPDLIEEGQQDILKEVFDKFKEIKGELK